MVLSGKSFVKHKTKEEPAVPCGRPDVTSAGALCSPFTVTHWHLSERKCFTLASNAIMIQLMTKVLV